VEITSEPLSVRVSRILLLFIKRRNCGLVWMFFGEWRFWSKSSTSSTSHPQQGPWNTHAGSGKVEIDRSGGRGSARHAVEVVQIRGRNKSHVNHGLSSRPQLSANSTQRSGGTLRCVGVLDDAEERKILRLRAAHAQNQARENTTRHFAQDDRGVL